MKMYIAGMYGRGPEYFEYANIIRALGHGVQARWLERSLTFESSFDEQEAALVDLHDIDACDAVASFLETPDGGYMSGGRHVEFGYAYAAGKKLFIIGKPENVFHHLPRVQQFDSFADFCEFLKADALNSLNLIKQEIVKIQSGGAKYATVGVAPSLLEALVDRYLTTMTTAPNHRYHELKGGS